MAPVRKPEAVVALGDAVMDCVAHVDDAHELRGGLGGCLLVSEAEMAALQGSLGGSSCARQRWRLLYHVRSQPPHAPHAPVDPLRSRQEARRQRRERRARPGQPRRRGRPRRGVRRAGGRRRRRQVRAELAASPSCSRHPTRPSARSRSTIPLPASNRCKQDDVAREYAETLRAPNLRARLSVSGSGAATAACLCLVRHPMLFDVRRCRRAACAACADAKARAACSQHGPPSLCLLQGRLLPSATPRLATPQVLLPPLLVYA